jgi:hypothetical protein
VQAAVDEDRNLNIQEFLAIALPPTENETEWLENATGAIEFLTRNSKSSAIILHTNVGQAYIHSVLARLDKVTPPDADDLQRSHAGADSEWAIEHCSGGGEPDRMYLSDPLDSPGCNSLVGGEQLVFGRQCTGVDKGAVRTELSQRLVQALGLYWLDEEKAYCRLDEDGDVEPIIRVVDMSKHTGETYHVLVTIDAEQLHRYMAVTEMALVMKFDFTRYRSGSFMGWHDPKRGEHNEGDLFYHSGVQSNSSFVNGALIMRPLLTKEMLIAKNQRNWDRSEKQHATFKAQDWKNNRLAEISCAPTALASYFEKDSPLPFQITPAFFAPEVLQKYKSDPEKYTLEHRSIHARAGWYLETYDVNEAGQVHTYLRYLANLPYKEQLYWQAFNEWPKSPISKRAFETDFEGNFSTIADPLVDLKYKVSKLDKAQPDWWQPRGDSPASALHYPITPSPEEWANAVLVLDQFVVEGFVQKALKARTVNAGRAVDKQWGSIRLLQECLLCVGLDEVEAVILIEPLRQTHFLRTKVKGHLAESEKQALIRQARTEHGSLAAHFRKLVTDVLTSLDRIVELL